MLLRSLFPSAALSGAYIPEYADGTLNDQRKIYREGAKDARHR